MMSNDLVLKTSCGACGSASELYGSICKHLTLCCNCGKTMAEKRGKCHECGVTVTKLIREYNVRSSVGSEKTFHIGRFTTGLPPFSKKRSAENKWSLQKEGLQGRHITDALRDKYKNKPWILENETGQHQFQGQLEGAHSEAYYLLIMQGKEFVAMPAGSWYNFNKIAQYKQLTLEEAEEKMNKRKNNATGYERWMMKLATNGPAAFGETNNLEGPSGTSLNSIRLRKVKTEDDSNYSSHLEEGDEEDVANKSKLGFNKGGSDDEEAASNPDLDLDDDGIEKGDDWEHEENFTDDDEAVGNDPYEREDLDPEIPAPPEIKQVQINTPIWQYRIMPFQAHWKAPMRLCWRSWKALAGGLLSICRLSAEDMMNHQNFDDADVNEEGGLSKSGKELQKLLGRTNGSNNSDAEDGDDDDDVEDETNMSPVLAPKNDALKQEPDGDASYSKQTPSASIKAMPSKTKSAKSKRKHGSEEANKNGPTKKLKKENDSKNSSKVEHTPALKSTASIKVSSAEKTKSASNSSLGPVSEKEIQNVLLTTGPIKTQELVAKFKPRLQEKKDKDAFAEILKRISKIQKLNGSIYVVLKEGYK